MSRLPIEGHGYKFHSLSRDIVRRGLSSLPIRLRKYLFVSLGKSLNVSLVQADGPLGKLFGSIHDNGVFHNYLRQSEPFDFIIDYVSEFFAGRGGGTFIDIGANIGMVTIPIARNPSVVCMSFEPEPFNYQVLNWNVGLNCPHHNVTTYNLALFDQTSVLRFELSPFNFGDHRVRSANSSNGGNLFAENDRQIIEVRAVPLDDALDLSSIKKPLVLKLDTQGAEPQIIRGGKRVIAETDLMLFEFWPYGMKRMGGNVDQLLSTVADNFISGTILRTYGEGALTAGNHIEFTSIASIVDGLARSFRDTASHEHLDVFVRR